MIRYDSEGPGTPAAAGRSMEPAGASGCPATHPHDTPSRAYGAMGKSLGGRPRSAGAEGAPSCRAGDYVSMWHANR